MASASLFCLNASSGYLSLAAARAGAAPNGRLPRPSSATEAAPCRIRRRVAVGPVSVVISGLLTNLLACLKSQGLQEINDRADLLVGQNPVPAERRHHGLRIALGLVEDDRGQLVAIGVPGLEVLQFRPDRSRQVATPDDMAGQAIALAAVESEFLAVGHNGLRPRRAGEAGGNDQQDEQNGRPGKGGQGVIPKRYIDGLDREIEAFQSTKGTA